MQGKSKRGPNRVVSIGSGITERAVEIYEGRPPPLDSFGSPDSFTTMGKLYAEASAFSASSGLPANCYTPVIVIEDSFTKTKGWRKVPKRHWRACFTGAEATAVPPSNPQEVPSWIHADFDRSVCPTETEFEAFCRWRDSKGFKGRPQVAAHQLVRSGGVDEYGYIEPDSPEGYAMRVMKLAYECADILRMLDRAIADQNDYGGHARFKAIEIVPWKFFELGQLIQESQFKSLFEKSVLQAELSNLGADKGREKRRKSNRERDKKIIADYRNRKERNPAKSLSSIAIDIANSDKYGIGERNIRRILQKSEEA